MIDGPFGSVLTRGPGFHQKCPITCLGEQEFTSKLFQNALSKLFGRRSAGQPFAGQPRTLSGLPYNSIGVLSREIGHSLGGDVQMRINPPIGGIEPDCKMAVLAPGRSGGLNDLLRGVGRQKFTRIGEPQISCACRLADELLQEYRSFEPPMTE